MQKWKSELTSSVWLFGYWLLMQCFLEIHSLLESSSVLEKKTGFPQSDVVWQCKSPHWNVSLYQIPGAFKCEVWYTDIQQMVLG